MQLPLIHLNGTAKDALIADALDAHRSLREADTKLCLMGQNGRDYYPLGDAAFKAARLEHHARIGKVREVINELEAWIQGVDAGGHQG